MAKQQQQTEESFLDIGFPSRGLDVTDEYAGQMPLTTTDCVNVRTYEAMTRRGRGGIRPGISRYIDQRVGGLDSPIQHMNFIVDPQSIALVAPSETIPTDTISADYIPDPSTNNLRERNPGLGGGPGVARYIRRKGNARQTNKNVPRRTPTINWSNPADIMSGTPLSATQLNATATSGAVSVAGTFTYTPPSGTVLSAGNSQVLSVTFVPTDTGMYRTPAGKTVHINVITASVTNPRGFTFGYFNGSPGAVSQGSVTAGSLIIIAVRSGSYPPASSTVTTVLSDNQGNTYTQIGGYLSVTVSNALSATYTYRHSLWYTIAGSSGVLTVTSTPSDSSSHVEGILIGDEFTGIAASSPLESSASASGTITNTGTVSAGSVSCPTYGDLVVGYFFVKATIDDNYETVGAGYQHTNGSGNPLSFAVWKQNPGVTAQTPSIAFADKPGLPDAVLYEWLAIAASFKRT